VPTKHWCNGLGKQPYGVACEPWAIREYRMRNILQEHQGVPFTVRGTPRGRLRTEVKTPVGMWAPTVSALDHIDAKRHVKPPASHNW